MSFKKPTNSIAVEINKLRSSASDIDVQIEMLNERKAQIEYTITALDPHATWDDESPEDESSEDAQDPISYLHPRVL